jgi:hypothetical protein
VLVAVSIAACAVVVALHLHAGFRTLSRVTTISAISTFGPTISKRRAGKGTSSHKGSCAKDDREAVANAAES